MRFSHAIFWLCAVAGLATEATVAHGEATSFTDATAWQSAVNSSYVTVDFTGLPEHTFVTDQYADQGILFQGTNLVRNTPGFVNDDWGLFGPNGMRFTFDTPQNWIAVDYPGAVQFQLLSDGEIIFTSVFFQPGGLGNFAGLVSDTAFDEVYLFKSVPPSQNSIFVDDLHWGSPVPAQGGFAILAMCMLANQRKRRA